MYTVRIIPTSESWGKIEKKFSDSWELTLWKFQTKIYWSTIVSGSVAAITASETGMRAGCLEHLYLAGRRHIKTTQQNTECECSITVLNDHTSSRRIISAVYHTSANNFIKDNPNKSTDTAQQWVFKWSWNVLSLWVSAVCKPKKVVACLPDIRHTDWRGDSYILVHIADYCGIQSLSMLDLAVSENKGL